MTMERELHMSTWHSDFPEFTMFFADYNCNSCVDSVFSDFIDSGLANRIVIDKMDWSDDGSS